MGMFDTFVDGKEEAQLKCFSRTLEYYAVGDDVSLELRYHKFPLTCTIADRGTNVSKFPIRDNSLLGDNYYWSTLVVFEDGIFTRITLDDSQIVYPLYDKYGGLLHD